MGRIVKNQAITKYIFQSGVGAVSNGRFSHHRSVLADRNEAPKSAPQHVRAVIANRKR